MKTETGYGFSYWSHTDVFSPSISRESSAKAQVIYCQLK
jgi:hypothetical protein